MHVIPPVKHGHGRVEAKKLGVEFGPRLSIAAGVLPRDLYARLARGVPSLELAVHLVIVDKILYKNNVGLTGVARELTGEGSGWLCRREAAKYVRGRVTYSRHRGVPFSVYANLFSRRNWTPTCHHTVKTAATPQTNIKGTPVPGRGCTAAAEPRTAL